MAGETMIPTAPSCILFEYEVDLISALVDRSGNFLATSSLSCYTKIWDIQTSKLTLSISTKPLECWAMDFSSDSKYLYTSSTPGKIDVFKVETGEKLRSLDTKGDRVLSLTTSLNGKWIACGGFDGGIAILDGESGLHVKTLVEHTKCIRALKFSHDSKFLVASSDDTLFRVYVAPEFGVKGAITCDRGWIKTIEFSPSGKRFATCSSDKIIRVSNSDNFVLTHIILDSDYKHVSCISWRTETQLVAVGEDNRIKIYYISEVK